MGLLEKGWVTRPNVSCFLAPMKFHNVLYNTVTVWIHNKYASMLWKGVLKIYVCLGTVQKKQNFSWHVCGIVFFTLAGGRGWGSGRWWRRHPGRKWREAGSIHGRRAGRQAFPHGHRRSERGRSPSIYVSLVWCHGQNAWGKCVHCACTPIDMHVLLLTNCGARFVMRQNGLYMGSATFGIGSFAASPSCGIQ